jgi:hypothetical protein
MVALLPSVRQVWIEDICEQLAILFFEDLASAIDARPESSA